MKSDAKLLETDVEEAVALQMVEFESFGSDILAENSFQVLTECDSEAALDFDDDGESENKATLRCCNQTSCAETCTSDSHKCLNPSVNQGSLTL